MRGSRVDPTSLGLFLQSGGRKTWPILAVVSHSTPVREIFCFGKGNAGYLLRSVHQQRAFRFERTKLFCIAKPPASIGCWRWRWIHDSFVRDVRESGAAEKFNPFLAGQEMRPNREQLTPLVAMRIVAVIVDQNP